MYVFMYNQFLRCAIYLFDATRFDTATLAIANRFLEEEMTRVESWNHWGSFPNPLARKKITLLLGRFCLS
jgi:hypothetical protein